MITLRTSVEKTCKKYRQQQHKQQTYHSNNNNSNINIKIIDRKIYK